MAEVKLGRYAGPYRRAPCKYFIQSPIGVINKAQPGQTRLIFHLSHPKNSSVNYYTPKELCSVQYRDLDNAIRLCLQARQGCYLAKSDMKSAFWNLPVRPEDWQWLVM